MPQAGPGGGLLKETLYTLGTDERGGLAGCEVDTLAALYVAGGAIPDKKEGVGSGLKDRMPELLVRMELCQASRYADLRSWENQVAKPPALAGQGR